MKIRKASGSIEDFNPGKLLESLVRSGADKEQAEEVIKKVMPEIIPYTNTKNIYRLAHKYLRQFNRASVLRYSLKKALLRLGPTGYPFERYYGELLKQYGYDVQVGVILEGRCVKHEVDVFATNEHEIALVECKYRNRAQNAPDVKVAMYVHSRFLDLKPVITSKYPGKSFAGWLVTNTRFTSDAIQFANCYRLNIRSWRYPESSSIEKMIENKKLYPVTVLSTLKSGQIRRLIENRVILMKDLSEMRTDDIGKILSITDRKALSIKKQAEELCLCNT
jgi:Holliday junction resolvase